MKNHSRKVPTLIAVITLLVGVMAGIMLIQRQQSVTTSASVEITPYNVSVSNIQEDSFTVSWTTDEPTVGFLLWGKGTNPVTPAQSIGGGSKVVHMVKVKSLEADTDYSFSITSGGNEYKNGDKPWGVRTGNNLEFPSSSKVISGTVESRDGNPLSQAIVIVSSDKMSPLSTTTSSAGTWVIPLSLARSSDLSEHVVLQDDILDITVLGGSQAKATAKVYGNISGLLPPIVIGQAHDFTTLQNVVDNSTPSAQLELPSSDVQGISDSNVVTLKSVDNGEVIFTNSPEFFGEGPPGSEIEITVHSDPVSGSTQVANDGQWSWSPGQILENGLHNITVKWTDSLGIIHTITRSFVVQAQEGEPSFESTPSATTSPTATPSPSPSPTASAKATSTPVASPTVTPKSQNLPDAGVASPSLLLGAVGFVTLSLGAIIALKNK